MLAGQRYGKVGEWTGADAAKHMAWQAELARCSLLPAPLAAAVANVAGLGKEVFIDGLGSAGLAVTGGGSPTGTWKNSLMDLWNNYIGAKNGYSPEQAVEVAGRSTNSIVVANFKSAPKLTLLRSRTTKLA